MFSKVKNMIAHLMLLNRKVKAVSYQQLMSRKLLHQNVLSMYEVHGLRDKE